MLNSSAMRKRALRKLATREYATYRRLYEAERAVEPNPDPRTARVNARGRAWTRLRALFPDDYLELYALEKTGLGEHPVPALVRSRAWQSATTALRAMRTRPYQEQMAKLRAAGYGNADAYHRAMTVIRQEEQELFAELYADQIRAWQEANPGGEDTATAGEGKD